MRLPKKIIDANVILRFLLEDEEKQSLKAKAFMQRLEFGEEEVLMTEIVFAEVVWVLNKVYEIPRKEITDKVTKLINYNGLKTMPGKEILTESLRLYSLHSMDIQDILLAVFAKTKECSIVTFDKKDFGKLECDFAEP